jgi:glucokinase
MADTPKIEPISQSVAPFFLGIDVGGTNIKIGIIDDEGRTVAYESIETNEPAGPDDAMRRVAITCKSLARGVGLEWEKIVRAGLGTPGSQNIAKGMLIHPPNHPHWWNFPIVSCLEGHLGMPVSFANDANAAAFGEFWLGTGRKFDSMAMLTLGTGVGGGIISDGMMLVGENSYAAEIGHVIVDSRPDARLCVWGGGRGHLEAYASASAVAAIAQERCQGNSQTRIGRDGAKVSAKSVYEAALQDDPLAWEIIQDTAAYLGIGIATVVFMVDPGLVVLGGAMDFGGPSCPVGCRFLEMVREAFKKRSFEYVASGTTIDFALLGGDAGYLGAGGLARQFYHQDASRNHG